MMWLHGTRLCGSSPMSACQPLLTLPRAAVQAWNSSISYQLACEAVFASMAHMVAAPGLQEPRVQPRAVRAVQAEPRAPLHRQLCAKVLGRRPAAGQVRRRDPGEARAWAAVACNEISGCYTWQAAIFGGSWVHGGSCRGARQEPLQQLRIMECALQRLSWCAVADAPTWLLRRSSCWTPLRGSASRTRCPTCGWR